MPFQKDVEKLGTTNKTNKKQNCTKFIGTGTLKEKLC